MMEPGQSGGGHSPRAVDRKYEAFSNGRILQRQIIAQRSDAQIGWPVNEDSSLRS
jgi:hypothetical protein